MGLAGDEFTCQSETLSKQQKNPRGKSNWSLREGDEAWGERSTGSVDRLENGFIFLSLLLVISSNSGIKVQVRFIGSNYHQSKLKQLVTQLSQNSSPIS